MYHVQGSEKPSIAPGPAGNVLMLAHKKKYNYLFEKNAPSGWSARLSLIASSSSLCPIAVCALISTKSRR
jgi:hypothetical protein